MHRVGRDTYLDKLCRVYALLQPELRSILIPQVSSRSSVENMVLMEQDGLDVDWEDMESGLRIDEDWKDVLSRIQRRWNVSPVDESRLDSLTQEEDATTRDSMRLRRDSAKRRKVGRESMENKIERVLNRFSPHGNTSEDISVWKWIAQTKSHGLRLNRVAWQLDVSDTRSCLDFETIYIV